MSSGQVQNTKQCAKGTAKEVLSLCGVGRACLQDDVPHQLEHFHSWAGGIGGLHQHSAIYEAAAPGSEVMWRAVQQHTAAAASWASTAGDLGWTSRSNSSIEECFRCSFVCVSRHLPAPRHSKQLAAKWCSSRRGLLSSQAWC